MKKIHVGTSGWSYRHWAGPFYPEHLSPDRYLDFYAKRFAAVEINSTFYRLPEHKTLAAWRDRTPEGFVFACKASQYITHMKKLKDPQDSLARLFRAMDGLGEKLGPILFQMPPRWHVNLQRLADFLSVLPGNYRYAFEFRDESWFSAGVHDLLEKNGAATCFYDLNGRVSPLQVTGSFIYVRLHGPDGPYCGKYNQKTLMEWADRLLAWQSEGREVFCFFDNDEKAYAAADAGRLLGMVERACGS
jgi:uncharacterized protein YecE (DUF72 family)